MISLDSNQKAEKNLNKNTADLKAKANRSREVNQTTKVRIEVNPSRAETLERIANQDSKIARAVN